VVKEAIFMNPNPGYASDYRMLPRRTRSRWFQQPSPRELSLGRERARIEDKLALAKDERNRLGGCVVVTRRDEEGRACETRRFSIHSLENLETALRQAGLIPGAAGGQAYQLTKPRYSGHALQYEGNGFSDPSLEKTYQPVSPEWFQYRPRPSSIPEWTSPHEYAQDPMIRRFRWRYDPHHHQE